MNAAAAVTLVGVALVVVALAAYLLIIIGTLIKISSNLDKILKTVVHSARDKATPLEGTVREFANNVAAIEQELAGLAPGRRRAARAR